MSPNLKRFFLAAGEAQRTRHETLQLTSRSPLCQTGLGVRFTIEIENTIRRIIEAPTRWKKIEGDIRRCLAHAFPYGVLYSTENNRVTLLAVMHHSRKPGYWRTRTR